MARLKEILLGSGETKQTDGGTNVSRMDGLRGVSRSEFVRSMPYWLIPLVFTGFFVYGGIGWNVIISMTDYSGFATADYSNLDFEMYIQALTSETFIAAARNTFVLLVAFTVICLVFGLGLAILLDRQIRFKEQIQTIYLLPMALSFVVTAQFWLWMYDYNSGLVNLLLDWVGIGRVHLIGNPQFVLAAIGFALIWQFSGYTMIVYLAGLQSIPSDQFEAAATDGASTFRIYWRIIIPQLKSSSVSAAVVLMIFGLKTFTFIYSMFGTYRPPKGADILATLMVRQAFKFQEWAYAAAIATLLLLMSLGIIGPYLYYQHRQGSL
jgi:glucose/mannose transport system permease protein